MLPLTNKKWRNVLVLGVFFFGIILFSEVLPILTSTIEQLWSYAVTINSDINTEELKQTMSYNINTKRNLISIRKGLFKNTLKTTSNAAIIMSIDSIGKKNGCRLISVQPIEGKENPGNLSFRFQFKTAYTSLYNMIHDIHTLPVLFTVKELSCEVEEGQFPDILVVNFLIALIEEKGEGK